MVNFTVGPTAVGYSSKCIMNDWKNFKVSLFLQKYPIYFTESV